MNAFLLMMGGTGTRFGKSRPKQYTEIDGRPLFSYIVEKVDRTPEADRLVVVSHADWLDYAREWTERYVKHTPFDVVEGGENRSGSVLNGLTKLSEYCDEQDVVMIHDATHPYLDSENLGALIEAVKEYGGATMASKNYDTVYRMDAEGFLEKVEPRELIVAGASPEAFRFGDIYRIYRQSTPEEMSRMTSAGAIALAYHIPMKVIPSPVLNLKITYPQDFDLLLKLLHGYFFD